MAVRYKLYQNTRKGSTTEGKWYARVAVQGVVGTEALTEIMQENCTVKKSDVRAVLTELVSAMKTSLQNGMRVKLDGFGSFKIGMSTKAADSAKEFSVGKNIKGLRVIFQPEVYIDAVHKRTKTFLAGCTVKEADPYEVDKSEEEEVKP